MTWKKVGYRSIKVGRPLLALWSDGHGDRYAHGLVSACSIIEDEGKFLWVALKEEGRYDDPYSLTHDSLAMHRSAPPPSFGFRTKGYAEYIGQEVLGVNPVGGNQAVVIPLDGRGVRRSFYAASTDEGDLPGDQALYEALTSRGWRSRTQFNQWTETWMRARWSQDRLGRDAKASEFIGEVDMSRLATFATGMLEEILEGAADESSVVCKAAGLLGEIKVLASLDYEDLYDVISRVQSLAYGRNRTLQERDGVQHVKLDGGYFIEERRLIAAIMNAAGIARKAGVEEIFNRGLAVVTGDKAWDEELQRRRFLAEGNRVDAWLHRIIRRRLDVELPARQAPA